MELRTFMRKRSRKAIAYIMAVAMVLSGFGCILPALPGGSVYAEEWAPSTEQPVLVMTGQGIISDAAVTADDLTAGIVNEKSYTRDELLGMTQSEVLYSTINTTPTKSIYLGKGVKANDLLALSGFTSDKYDSINIRFISGDGYTVTFDNEHTGDSTTSSPLVTASYGTERYYYPGISTGDDTGAVVADTILALEKAGNRGEPDVVPETAALTPIASADAPMLMLGQQNVNEISNPLFNKGIAEIVVGDELPDVLTIAGGSYSRADVLMMPRIGGTWTYLKSVGTGTNYCVGVPLSEFMAGYEDDATVEFVSADGYANTSVTVGDIRNAANEYILAYEFGADEASCTGIYESAKNDATIKGYFRVYAQNGSVIKLVNEIVVTPASGPDFSTSPYKHINNGGLDGDAPYNVDSITGATLTVEGPGLESSIPLSIREMESENAGAYRDAYTDIRDSVPTTLKYEGIRLDYILHDMTSGTTGIELTDSAYSVVFKNRQRQTIAEFTLDEIADAESAGKPVIIAYGTADLAETNIRPFVYDGGAGADASLGNEDGCIKLVYDKSVFDADPNPDYTKFGNVAYIYVAENEAPGFKHDKSPYNTAENAQYVVTVTGDKVGREINYTVDQLESMVPYDVNGEPAADSAGFRAEYSLSNSTYWYVNEYEGVKLWNLLVKSGIPESMATGDGSDTEVKFSATDSYQDFDKFTLAQIADPTQFGYYEKNPADLNDGTYVPVESDLKATGYPVLVSYGVNGYPFVISNTLDGFKSGLGNDGGPLRIISGKMDYTHANGSKQAKLLDKIIVGNEVDYSTHGGNPDANYQALADDQVAVSVIGMDGNPIKNQTYTVDQIEDLVYGDTVTNAERTAARVKDFYSIVKSGVPYSDLYEGVDFGYFLTDVVEIPGIKGTVTFTGAVPAGGGEAPTLTVSLDDIFASGQNTVTERTDLTSVLAFAKNGYPMVLDKVAAGYVSTFLDGSGATVTVKNSGGPLMMILPQSEIQASDPQASTSLSNITAISINLQPDSYAHIASPYDTLATSQITIGGEGTKLSAPSTFTVGTLEGKQTLAVTGDYNIKSADAEQQIRYRGLDLYSLLKSTDVGLQSNASEIVVTCADATQMTFPLTALIKSDYVNGATGASDLKMILAYGSASVDNIDPEDGLPLVGTSADAGYDASYMNDGGPLCLVVGQTDADDINSAKILKDVVDITVNASETTSWKHDMSPIYESYLDSTSIEVSGTGIETPVTMTLREIEAMDDIIVRDSYTYIGTHECEGVDLWKLVTEKVGLLENASVTSVKVVASDAFSKDVLSIFGQDALDNGIADGSDRKTIILSYAIDGNPLVPETSSDGYTSGNDGGPLKLITHNNQGACLKNVVKVVVDATITAPVEADFTIAGAPAGDQEFMVSDLEAHTDGAITRDFSYIKDSVVTTDMVTGVRLDRLLAEANATGDRFKVNIVTTDGYADSKGGTYTNITLADVTDKNYVVAYEAGAAAIADTDGSGNVSAIRIYRDQNDGTVDWRNRVTNVSGIQVVDTMDNEVVFTIKVDGTTAASYTLAQLKAMTPETQTYSYTQKGIACTNEATGVMLADLLTSAGITQDSAAVTLITTDNFQAGTSANALTYNNILMSNIRDQQYMVAYAADGAAIRDADKGTTIQYTYTRVYRAYDDGTATWLNRMTNVVAANAVPDYLFETDLTGAAGGLPLAGVRCIAPDSNGGIWIGTYGGGAVYKNAAGAFTLYSAASETALPGNYVPDIATDGNGGIWFALGGQEPANQNGAAYFKDGVVTAYTYENTSGKLISDFVQQVEVDAGGDVWFGTAEGLCRLDPATNTWSSWDKSDGIPAASVSALVPDGNGGMWIGCYPDTVDEINNIYSGGYAHLKSNGAIVSYKDTINLKFADQWVRSFAIDEDGGAWVVRSGSYSTMENVGGRIDYVYPSGTAGTHYTGHDLLPEQLVNNAEIRTMAIDANGGLWFGSTSRGVYYSTEAEIVSEHYCRADVDWPNTSSLDSIFTILPMSEGTLYVGSNGGVSIATIDAIIENTDPGDPGDPGAGQEDYDLAVTGDGVDDITYLTVADLKKMAGDGYVRADYSSLNSYGTRAVNTFTGIEVSFLLDDIAEINDDAESISVIASDDYYRNFNLDDEDLGVYAAPIDPNSGDEVPMILAWARDGANLDGLQLVVGQSDIDHINKPLWVNDIVEIEVNAKAVTPGSGTAGTGEQEPPEVTDEETPSASVEVEASLKDGSASVTIEVDDISDAIALLEDTDSAETVLEIVIDGASGAGKFSMTLPADTLGVISSSDGLGLRIILEQIQVTFDNAAVAEIDSEAAGSVSIVISEADKTALTEDVLNMIGERPLYDIDILSGSGKISSLGDGQATISIPYKLTAGEDPDELVIFLVKDDGSIVPVKASGYDAGTGSMLFVVNHFSQYGIGYNSCTFGDISGHWAENDIQYLSARGMASGTGNGAFEPNRSLTRAEFVKFLAGIADADIAGKASAVKFKDVSADKWYAAYIGWAAENDIVSGYADGNFGPNDVVTREQMAVMIDNFAKSNGIELEQVKAYESFTDESGISSWASDSVKKMQTAAIMNGKPNNIFDAKGLATRAEAARIISGLLGLSID